MARPAPFHAGSWLATLGSGLTGLAVVMIGLLHVLPPSREISPLRRTISEYALGANGWLFDLGVLTLAAGSAVVLVGLVRGGVAAARGIGTLLVGTWVIALVVLVIFEKTNWQLGPSLGGVIHRWASLVAFLSLPIGALLVSASGGRNARWRVEAALTRWSAILALVCFSPLVYAIAQSPFTGVRWWRVFPLGGLERLLGLAEVLVVLALAWWARRAASAPPASAWEPAPELSRAS